MKRKLFGLLGDKVKNNTLIIVLCVCVIAAGTISYYSVKDINNKIKNQQIKGVADSKASQSEQIEDVQKEQNNVPLQPLPSPTAKPDDKAVDTVPQEPVEVDSTAFEMPVTGGEIFNAFSRDELVYNKTMEDWRTHNGIDIKASKDAAVRAGADGMVKNIYTDGMLGTVVEIEGKEYTARYCGLAQKVQVQKGDSVTRGQTIGAVGEIALELSEVSHIHVEIIKDGVPVDPLTYLQ